MKDRYEISLKILLKNFRGEILAVKARDDSSWAPYYELPGGRIEVHEFRVPFQKTIARELREELGPVKYRLNLQPVGLGRHLISANFSSTHDTKHVLLILFEARFLGGAIKISDEHTGYKWVKLSRETLSRHFKSGVLEALKMYLKNYAN
jgi:8-oxo-dGTP pyrophosphatase MutT (NUDIX family)